VFAPPAPDRWRRRAALPAWPPRPPATLSHRRQRRSYLSGPCAEILRRKQLAGAACSPASRSLIAVVVRRTERVGRGVSLSFLVRRVFLTDAVMHGMPPHIAQLVAGHRDINVTMGYEVVYPEEVINGHPAFIARRRALRPAAEYRTPTDEEWQEFLGHFERRRVALGDCGRSYATPASTSATACAAPCCGLPRRNGTASPRSSRT
jgi:hypothetical protein